MDRIVGGVAAGSSVAAPPSGTVGHWSNGAPPFTPATPLAAYWFEALQEEHIAILTAAGIAPDRTNLTQILTALYTLFGFRRQVAIGPSGVLGTTPAGLAVTGSAGAFNLTWSLTGLALARVRLWGPGGCGGSSSSVAWPGGGGGGGGYVEGYLALTSGVAFAAGIPAGTSTAGANGADATFGPYTAHGGRGGSAGTGSAVGVHGVGGGAVGGSLIVPGGNGSDGIYFSSTAIEGGMGGVPFSGVTPTRSAGSSTTAFPAAAGGYPGGGSSGCTGTAAVSGGAMLVIDY